MLCGGVSETHIQDALEVAQRSEHAGSTPFLNLMTQVKSIPICNFVCIYFHWRLFSFVDWKPHLEFENVACNHCFVKGELKWE